MRKLLVCALLLAAGPAAGQKVIPATTLKVRFASEALHRAEHALRLRQDLNLSQEQVTQIDALRKEEVSRLMAHQQAMAELESRARAGLIDKAELQQQQSAISEPAPVALERINTILTEEQRTKLDQAAPKIGKFLLPATIKTRVPGLKLLVPSPFRRRYI
jgi:hypothetical protein